MTFDKFFKVAFWRGLTAILSFLTIILCMKNLSIDDFAEYSLVFTIYTAFCLLPNLGINNYMVLEEGDKKIIEKNDNIKIYFAFFVFGAYLLKNLNIIDDIIFYAVAGGIFSSVIDYNLSKYQARKEFHKYSLMMPLRTLVFLLGVIFVFYANVNKSIINIFYITGLIYLCFYLFFFFRNIKLSFFCFKANLSIYALSTSFLVFELCALLMMRLEVWVLSFYSEYINLSKLDIANYWAAFNFIMIMSMVSSTLANVVLPYIKKNKENNFSSLKKIINKVSILMIFSLIISIFFSYLMSIFYFDSNYKILPVYVFFLGLGVFVSFKANIERLKLMAGTENSKVNKFVIFQVLMSFLMNIVFIYFFGVWGAIFTFIIVRLLSWLFFKSVRDRNA